jgi:hypothetical protein
VSSITIHFKDGTTREFAPEGRAGGSWTKSVKYVDAMVIVEDEWGTRTAFPVADVVEVIERPVRGW